MDEYKGYGYVIAVNTFPERVEATLRFFPPGTDRRAAGEKFATMQAGTEQGAIGKVENAFRAWIDGDRQQERRS